MRDVLTDAFEVQNASTLASRSEAIGEFWNESLERGSQSQESRMDLNWTKGMEMSSQRMQDLKKNGLSHMNNWRTALLRRMGEALSVRPDTVKRARAQHTSRQSTAAYHSWADGEDTQLPGDSAASGLLVPFPKVTLPSTLNDLDDKTRALILGAVLFLVLSLENYSAYSRVLLSYLCQSLALPYDVLTSQENTTAATLLQAAGSKDGGSMDAEEARKKQADQGTFSRRWKIGLATVAGAVAIGVTGGLAAPLLLGVAGSIMGGIGLGGLATLLGATIANPVTIGALFGALGGKMTSSAMTEYSKEVEDFKFLPMQDVKAQASLLTEASPASSTDDPAHKLRVAVGVSGWVVKENDIFLPWRVLSSTTVEAFALRYEQEALMSLGSTLDSALKDTAYSVAQSGALQLVLPALAAAMMPIGLLKTGKFLDNPFTIAMERSDKAGKVLAHALIDRAQGERPVTLIGFSLGARVVYSCLEELATQSAFGLVENAILIGSPVPSSEMSWRRMRAMVAGRLVNVYTQRDMLLGFLYRARNIQFGIAGLQAITAAPNIENKDVSHIVTGHNQYRLAIGRILSELNFLDLDLEQVEEERSELEREKTYEKEIHDEAKREGRLKDVVDENGQIVMGGVATIHGSPSQDLIDLSESTETSLTEQLGKTGLEDNSPDVLSHQSHSASIQNEEKHHALKTGVVVDHDDDHDEDEDEEHDRQPSQMVDIEPEALPDSPATKTSFGDNKPERIRFGSPDRGINLTWNEKRT